jgi:hypothetical protein
MPETPQSNFEQGRESGRQDQKLAEHAEHLAAINGSVEKTATAMAALTEEVRALREEDRAKRERAARLYKYTTLAISVALAILAFVSYLRGSPFWAMHPRILDACLIGLWVLAVVVVGLIAFH